LAQDIRILEKLLEQGEADGESERDDHQEDARGAADGEAVHRRVSFLAKSSRRCRVRQGGKARKVDGTSTSRSNLNLYGGGSVQCTHEYVKRRAYPTTPTPRFTKPRADPRCGRGG